MDDNETTASSCGMGHGFNFCFWAKFIIGIPALAICGYVAALQFHSSLMQAVAWIVTVMALVWVAQKVDKMPALQNKIRPGRD